ncbi:MAG TPA: MATE family efflux transporter, partial [Spirochaetota bacterium]
SLLIKRIIRFGAPSGAQFFLDVAGFAAFIIFVGALGDVPLAASNIAFSINTLAFMPMIGIGIAVSIFVGQNMGGKNISGAKKSVWSGFHIAFTYMCLIAAAYLFYPHLFLDPFLSGGRYSHTGEIMNVAIVLLRFVAVYTIFDSLNMIFGSALKGAGDTKFVMLSNIGLTLFVLVIPSFVLIRFAHANIFGAWYVAALYIVILGLCFLIRFLTGKWTLMRVIEEVQVPVSGRCRPEVPTVE